MKLLLDVYTHSGGNTTGIVVVDTNDPSDPFAIEVYTPAITALSTIIQSEDISIGEYSTGQTYAIVARGAYGLAVLDLTDFYNPAILGFGSSNTRSRCL